MKEFVFILVVVSGEVWVGVVSGFSVLERRVYGGLEV